jgi:BclA C-terminal domain
VYIKVPMLVRILSILVILVVYSECSNNMVRIPNLLDYPIDKTCNCRCNDLCYVTYCNATTLIIRCPSYYEYFTTTHCDWYIYNSTCLIRNCHHRVEYYCPKSSCSCTNYTINNTVIVNTTIVTSNFTINNTIVTSNFTINNTMVVNNTINTTIIVNNCSGCSGCTQTIINASCTNITCGGISDVLCFGSSGNCAYGYIYNLAAGTVAIETTISFSDNGPLNGVTHATGSDSIAVTNAGVYKIDFSVSGVEPNQFAIFINGAPLGSSVYGSGAGTQQNTGILIVSLAADDTITLVNHSSAAAVTLQTLAGGTQINVNAAIVITQLNC